MMLTSLRDVLNDLVRDLYIAGLNAAITGHLEETREQANRLEKACEVLGIKAKGKTCQAMKG